MNIFKRNVIVTKTYTTFNIKIKLELYYLDLSVIQEEKEINLINFVYFFQFVKSLFLFYSLLYDLFKLFHFVFFYSVYLIIKLFGFHYLFLCMINNIGK